MGAALASGLSPLGMVKILEDAKVRPLLGLASGNLPEASAPDACGLDELLIQWENRQTQGEDVSGAVAERLKTDQLNLLPDALVQRVYGLLFGTNHTNGTAGTTAGPATEAMPGPGAGNDEITGIVRASVAEVLQLAEIDDERSFMEYGLDSIAGMKLAVRLEKRLKREVPPQLLISFPTVSELSKQLC
jgi:acyl carrier protein